MAHRLSLPYARGSQRSTYNYSQVMSALQCSKRHVYNLFDRGELQGYFVGDRRGLRIYVDSVEKMKIKRSVPNE